MISPLPALDGASLAEAQAVFLAGGEPLEPILLPLGEAQNHALASPIQAPMALPPYDNSAMDGYALRSSDVAEASADQPVALTVVGEASAGHALPGVLAARQATRIMTGAPLPTGADAVLPNEEATYESGILRVTAPLLSARHVRRVGEDVAMGHSVFAAGKALGPAELALLAALGFSEVRVVRQPRVAVLTTGDELRRPGEARGASGIYNANLSALCAQLREAGAEPVPLPSSADQPAAIDAALSAALEADAVVTSAGVCTGDHDYVCATLRCRGAFVTGCLRLRPARHVGLGEVDGRPVFALPGNPAASLLAFELLVRPAILRMGGHCTWRRPQVRATLGEAIRHSPGVTHVFWVRLEATTVGYRCVLSGAQGAGMLSSAAAADGLLVIPESSPGYAAGDIVSVQLLTGIALSTCDS